MNNLVMDNPVVEKAGNYITIIAAVIGLTVICGLAYLYHDTKKDLTESELARSSLETRYNSLVEQVEQKAKSDKETQEVIETLKQQLSTKGEASDKIEQDVKTNVAVISQKYDKLPPSDSNQLARDKEISAARIEGLWKTFCLNNPTHERCKQ